MIKASFIFIFLLALSFTQAQVNPASTFRIKGQVKSLPVEAKITLTLRENDQWVEYSTETKSGIYTLVGAVNEPSFAYLVMKYNTELDKGPYPGNVLELFVDNSVINVTAKDSLIDAAVQGGSIQAEFDLFQRSIKSWRNQKISERKESAKNKIISEFIQAHRDSYVSLYVLQNFSMNGDFVIDGDKVKPLFDLLSADLRNTSSGKALEKDIRISQQTAIGTLAPDFTQRDTMNTDVRLSSLRGKYVLIDFWASWCKPCRVENPELVKTFNEYKEKDFTIISVSLDNNKNNWKRAIIKDQLTWTHVSDLKYWKNAVAQLYGVKTVPQNFLLDPQGKIIDKNIKATDLSKKLKQFVDL